ncbi:MAG: hypothetical protein J7M26_02490, partial [Armatimonadetes bacterium]|nr:hypothetical protein [Armatimonadota bacterium]
KQHVTYTWPAVVAGAFEDQGQSGVVLVNWTTEAQEALVNGGKELRAAHLLIVTGEGVREGKFARAEDGVKVRLQPFEVALLLL